MFRPIFLLPVLHVHLLIPKPLPEVAVPAPVEESGCGVEQPLQNHRLARLDVRRVELVRTGYVRQSGRRRREGPDNSGQLRQLFRPPFSSAHLPSHLLRLSMRPQRLEVSRRKLVP